ncbi:YtxH domain-containing protein [Metabacillus sp. RGM 3146]|uniref:YtxH domain-containing protein n=1 Tax=Metabacillus sp. RGM 3146 TaxID=3401092 RepID=UPI003B9A9B76
MTQENENLTEVQNDVRADKEKKNKLLTGVLIGAIAGGVIAMIDSTTRNKVKKGAVGLKDSSVDVYNQVRENPSEVKDQLIDQVKGATSTLKSAIEDAQHLYERVNKVVGKVNDVVKISTQTLSIAKSAKSELGKIGSKVKDAGSEVKGGSTSAIGHNEGYHTESENNETKNQGANN